MTQEEENTRVPVAFFQSSITPQHPLRRITQVLKSQIQVYNRDISAEDVTGTRTKNS